MKRPLAVATVLLLAATVGLVMTQKARGPLLDGYPVTARPLVQTVVATGRVAAVSRVQVGSPVTGVVRERRVKEGDVVQPGDVLAVVRADELEASLHEAEAALADLQQNRRPQAEAALREARARLDQASRESTRRRDLFARGLIAREAMEQATQAETLQRAATEQARLAAAALAPGNPGELAAQARVATARAQRGKTVLRSEVAGTVLTRNVEPGDLVQPGRVLFEIARSGAAEVLVPLDEKNLEVLVLGQPAQCVADAYPSQPFPAELTYIAPSVDAQRGAIDVRLTVSPEPPFLRQDMTVTVNIETGRRDRAVVVPNDALDGVVGSQASLWAVVDGRATRRNVVLGLRGMAMSEVVDGLAEGEWVLADPAAALTEGQRIRLRTAALPAVSDAAATRRELPARLD